MRVRPHPGPKSGPPGMGLIRGHVKPLLADEATADNETPTCQLVAVLTRHNHHPVPLDGDGHGRAGQVSDVSDGDHQHVAGSLKKKKKQQINQC